MIRLKILCAAMVVAAMIAAPIAAQADEYYRRHHRHHHHHRHHIAWFSYIHNYGPGPVPGTWAYYDGPTSVRCKQSAAAYRGQDGRKYPCN
jgi:hypothetical protein